MDERGRQIQAKFRAGVRVPARESMVNSGRRRTRSKRDLLASIQRSQQEAGRPVAFEANFYTDRITSPEGPARAANGRGSPRLAAP